MIATSTDRMSPTPGNGNSGKEGSEQSAASQSNSDSWAAMIPAPKQKCTSDKPVSSYSVKILRDSTETKKSLNSISSDNCSSEEIEKEIQRLKLEKEKALLNELQRKIEQTDQSADPTKKLNAKTNYTYLTEGGYKSVLMSMTQEQATQHLKMLIENRLCQELDYCLQLLAAHGLVSRNTNEASELWEISPESLADVKEELIKSLHTDNPAHFKNAQDCCQILTIKKLFVLEDCHKMLSQHMKLHGADNCQKQKHSEICSKFQGLRIS